MMMVFGVATHLHLMLMKTEFGLMDLLLMSMAHSVSLKSIAPAITTSFFIWGANNEATQTGDCNS
jgi:hypothetical protein